MTYPEALAFLGRSRFFGMKPGLERMRRIAGRLGDPQKKLRFLHLAGTNGKGSTAAFAESCLRAHGLRVGLYTSPHLIGVRERVQIDRAPISENDFALGLTAVQGALSEEDGEATFFELTTALALWAFTRAGVDWVVWETGLGGRLDATNIVDPEICIITRIGLDHQRYLGETIREIAGEKAGIIKPRRPVVAAPQEADAARVLKETAARLDSSLNFADEFSDAGFDGANQLARINGRDYRLGLLGAHQSENAACAVAAVRAVIAKPDEQALVRGLETTSWPARFQILSDEPLIVLDGGHNPDGARMLAATWRRVLAARLQIKESATDGRAHLVFGCVGDKAVAEIAETLRPLAARVSLVRLASERSADPEQLRAFFSGLPCEIYSCVAEFHDHFLKEAAKLPMLITGSLLLAGEVLAHRSGRADEYQLNERLETPSSNVRV